MRADVGDWILRDPEGSCYVCKGSVFKASYEGLWDQETPEPAAEPEKGRSPADVARERAQRGSPKGIA